MKKDRTLFFWNNGFLGTYLSPQEAIIPKRAGSVERIGEIIPYNMLSTSLVESKVQNLFFPPFVVMSLLVESPNIYHLLCINELGFVSFTIR